MFQSAEAVTLLSLEFEVWIPVPLLVDAPWCRDWVRLTSPPFTSLQQQNASLQDTWQQNLVALAWKSSSCKFGTHAVARGSQGVMRQTVYQMTLERFKRIARATATIGILRGIIAVHHFRLCLDTYSAKNPSQKSNVKEE
jgi:hypothetical protein